MGQKVEVRLTCAQPSCFDRPPPHRCAMQIQLHREKYQKEETLLFVNKPENINDLSLRVFANKYLFASNLKVTYLSKYNN